MGQVGPQAGSVNHCSKHIHTVSAFSRNEFAFWIVDAQRWWPWCRFHCCYCPKILQESLVDEPAQLLLFLSHRTFHVARESMKLRLSCLVQGLGRSAIYSNMSITYSNICLGTTIKVID